MGEGCAARLFLFSFFPCSADHERDWPPGNVFFFGLATNALDVRSNIICIYHYYYLSFTNHHHHHPGTNLTRRVQYKHLLNTCS